MQSRAAVNRGEQPFFFPRHDQDEEALWAKLPLRVRQECMFITESVRTRVSGAPKGRNDFRLDEDRDFAAMLRDFWLLTKEAE